MSKTAEKERQAAIETFMGKLADLMAECPDDCPGFIALNPDLASETGREPIIPIPSMEFSDKVNKDGYPEFLNVGRTGKGGSLESVDGFGRLSFSHGFERKTETPKGKVSALASKWGKAK